MNADSSGGARPVGAKIEACMEDLFPDALKQIKVDGKSFDQKKDYTMLLPIGKRFLLNVW